MFRTNIEAGILDDLLNWDCNLSGEKNNLKTEKSPHVLFVTFPFTAAGKMKLLHCKRLNRCVLSSFRTVKWTLNTLHVPCVQFSSGFLKGHLGTAELGTCGGSMWGVAHVNTWKAFSGWESSSKVRRHILLHYGCAQMKRVKSAGLLLRAASDGQLDHRASGGGRKQTNKKHRRRKEITRSTWGESTLFLR